MRTTTAASALTPQQPLRKRKFLKRLLHCFGSKKTTTTTRSVEPAKPPPPSAIEEDMTSVVSATSDDGDQWLLHRGFSGDTVDMDTSDPGCLDDSMDADANAAIYDDDNHHATAAVTTAIEGATSSATRFEDDTAAASMVFLAPQQFVTLSNNTSKHDNHHLVKTEHTPFETMKTNTKNYKRRLESTTAVPFLTTEEEEEEEPTMEQVVPMLPQDVWREICFLVNDATTLCRLACVSKDLKQRVQDASPLVYQGLYQHRWIRSSPLSSSIGASSNSTSTSSATLKMLGATDANSTTAPVDWKAQFQRRFSYEGHVVRTIQQVVLLELEPEICDFEMLQQSQHGRIASIGIEHDGWRRLLQQELHDVDRSHGIPTPPLDVLCAMANADTFYHPAIAKVCSASRSRQLHPRTQAKRRALLRFAAASTTFTFHCQEVITEMANVWERSLYQQIRNPTFTTTPVTQLAYEETATLLSHALRSVPNLLQRTSSLAQLTTLVSQQLDQMAQMVQRHVTYYMDKRENVGVTGGGEQQVCDTREMLFTIHYVLSKHYCIRSHLPIRGGGGGGEDDVLHSCSISHVLLDYYQQGQREEVQYPNLCHPILVAIIYQAVARRVGLMGDILFCPEHCHTLLRFSSASVSSSAPSKTSDLLFLDLVQDPGRIMNLPQCQELIRTCRLMTEQDYSERNRRMLFSDNGHPNNPNNHDDDDDDLDEDVRTAFWSQPPMPIPSVVYWLAAPFFAKTHYGRGGNDDEEDQPFDFLLGQLVESSGGGGGRLISFLQDRMVFFTSIMRHCKLIS